MHLTTAHTKNPYMAGKPASENHPRVKAGVLLWKGYEMKKYIPVDFDEKGNVILGRERNTPTSNGFIPTTWVPGGGGDEGKQGLKSISISPAITTTPALDSLLPIYYDDLTEEQKQDGVILNLTSAQIPDGEYSVTVTPSENWYALGEGTASEQAGSPITFTENAIGNMMQIRFAASNTSDPGDDDDIVIVTVKINVPDA